VSEELEMSMTSNLIRSGLCLAAIGALAAGCRNNASEEQRAYGTPRPAVEGNQPNDTNAQPQNQPNTQGQPGVQGQQGQQGQQLGAQNALDRAVGSIASARCSFAARCQQIGQGKQYEDPNACMSDAKNKVQSDLKPSDCPNGVDSKLLSACTNALHSAECSTDFDSIKACDSSTLCASKGAQPGTQGTEPGTQGGTRQQQQQPMP
jgi:hypothetical protein